MTNTNCLSGIKCPKCGNESDFRIEASIICKVTDDGSEPSGDHHWDDSSYCYCPTCEFEGRLTDFSVEEVALPIDPPSLTTLLWDFIENGRSSYGLSFSDLRARVRTQAGRVG